MTVCNLICNFCRFTCGEPRFHLSSYPCPCKWAWVSLAQTSSAVQYRGKSSRHPHLSHPSNVHLVQYWFFFLSVLSINCREKYIKISHYGVVFLFLCWLLLIFALYILKLCYKTHKLSIIISLCWDNPFILMKWLLDF